MNKNISSVTKVFFMLITACVIHASDNPFQQFLDSTQLPSRASGSRHCEPSLPMVCLDPFEIKEEFVKALRGAKKQIVIASPYISDNSLRYSGAFKILQEKLKVNVRVLCLISSDLTKSRPYELRGIELLEGIGALVRRVNKLHAKYVLIDNQTLLLGSFNWLSGSLNPKYMYYQLNMMAKIEAPHVNAIVQHCLSIADEIAPVAPISKINQDFYVMSSKDDITKVQKHIMSAAKFLLEICSPNLSKNMLEVSGFLEILKSKVSQGVPVTIYADSEMDRKKPDYQEVRVLLKNAGVETIEKRGIHCKWVHDGENLYFGSDNLFAGEGQNTGEGYWRELGVYMANASTQISEIKKHVDATATALEIDNKCSSSTDKKTAVVEPSKTTKKPRLI